MPSGSDPTLSSPLISLITLSSMSLMSLVLTGLSSGSDEWMEMSEAILSRRLVRGRRAW